MPTSFTHVLHRVVFSTRDRREDLTPGLREAPQSCIDGIARGEGEIAFDKRYTWD